MRLRPHDGPRHDDRNAGSSPKDNGAAERRSRGLRGETAAAAPAIQDAVVDPVAVEVDAVDDEDGVLGAHEPDDRPRQWDAPLVADPPGRGEPREGDVAHAGGVAPRRERDERGTVIGSSVLDADGTMTTVAARRGRRRAPAAAPRVDVEEVRSAVEESVGSHGHHRRAAFDAKPDRTPSADVIRWHRRQRGHEIGFRVRHRRSVRCGVNR